MSREITGRIAAGKTTEALKKVGEKGGIFITPNSKEAALIAGRIGFANSGVQILELKPGTVIVIDDSQDFDVWEVVRKSPTHE